MAVPVHVFSGNSENYAPLENHPSDFFNFYQPITTVECMFTIRIDVHTVVQKHERFIPKKERKSNYVFERPQFIEMCHENKTDFYFDFNWSKEL